MQNTFAGWANLILGWSSVVLLKALELRVLPNGTVTTYWHKILGDKRLGALLSARMKIRLP